MGKACKFLFTGEAVKGTNARRQGRDSLTESQPSAIGNLTHRHLSLRATVL